MFFTVKDTLELFENKKIKTKPKIQLQEVEKIITKKDDVDIKEPTKIAAVSKPLLQQPQPVKKEVEFNNVFDEYLHDLDLASGNSYGVTSTKSWIKLQLRYKTKDKQEELLSRYREIYLEHYNKEPVEHKKANAGEYRANVWLRETIEKWR